MAQDVIALLPKAGPRASTDDKTNRFRIPEINQLMIDLREEGLEFKSLDDIRNVLIPKLDKLHHSFIMTCMAQLEDRGYDTSRFDPLKQVHKINRASSGIGCNLANCNFGLRIRRRASKDPNIKSEVYVFEGDLFSGNHGGPFH